MYKLLQIGAVLLYVLLSGICFLCSLALSGVYISWFTFFTAMTGWTLFCFLSIYILGPLNLFFYGHIRLPVFEEEKRLMGCFEEVLKSAGCPKKFRLRIAESDGPEVFACGTNIIAISKPLMNELTDDELKGIMAHELGHLASSDTMISRAFGTASLLPRAVCRIVSLTSLSLKKLALLLPLVGLILFAIFLFLFFFKPLHLMPVIAIVLFILTFSLLDRIFRWLRLTLSRLCEYRQDAYTHKLGHGAGLRDALKKLAKMEPQRVNIYFTLMHSTQPVIYHRIRRLEILEGMRDNFS
ncbi:MAG: M48 family metalloprotease [Chitinophagaceae bacterium]|nr:M48 family metalloprotease [Chitinophagaceae bacterium]